MRFIKFQLKQNCLKSKLGEKVFLLADQRINVKMQTKSTNKKVFSLYFFIHLFKICTLPGNLPQKVGRSLEIIYNPQIEAISFPIINKLVI
jgi:hypothetical protein